MPATRTERASSPVFLALLPPFPPFQVIAFFSDLSLYLIILAVCMIVTAPMKHDRDAIGCHHLAWSRRIII